MFDSLDDIQQKLGNTVILLDKIPVYILGSAYNPEAPGPGLGQSIPHEHMGFWYLPLPLSEKERYGTGKRGKKYSPIFSDNVDFRSISTLLGYINYFDNSKNISTFVARIPTRLSIQGLSSKNIMYYSSFEHHCPPWTTLLESKTVIDTFENKYPSISEVQHIFERDGDKTLSVAFHRNFAVNRKKIGPFFLEYKGQDIGWSSDFYRFGLDKKFNHLREVLEYNNIAFK